MGRVVSSHVQSQNEVYIQEAISERGQRFKKVSMDVIKKNLYCILASVYITRFEAKKEIH